MQRERKKRITKVEWYNLGGFANPNLFRKQSRGGAWRYYIALPDISQIQNAVEAGMREGFDVLREARKAGKSRVLNNLGD